VQVGEKVDHAAYFSLHDKNLHQVERGQPQELKLRLEDHNGQPLLLELYQAEFLSPDFRLTKASQPDRAIPFDPGLHYRGIVNGEPHSLAMLLIRKDEVSGLIEFRGRQYNLGKIEGTSGVHILYPADALSNPPVKGCYAEELPNYRPGDSNSGTTRAPDPNNCVKMYVEVDKDIHDDKGGVAQAASYVSGVFSQVSTLYADESINLVVSEVFVWEIEDPYTGPSTSDYLTQFRTTLNGDYNGADLAHLVGYDGGGGIAYLDVICSSTFGVGYSDINSTYNDVPTYSWTVNVVTHEIGHNLGSPHTHDCSWNGDNTPIDNCGPAAGYTPDGCFDNGQTPNAGTIMSYCHLVGGVGVSFTENFGQQPGDLIRNEVYNASCLSPCAAVNTTDAGITAIVEPGPTVCGSSVAPVVTLNNYGSETLTSVTIEYTLDNNATQSYNWSGNLLSQSFTAVTLPVLSFGSGNHTLAVATSSPNGQSDDDPSNDQTNRSFETGDNELTLTLTLDDYPEETSWSVTDAGNQILASGGGYGNLSPGTTVVKSICLPDGCYDFIIEDTYGDGICCSHGNGSYTLIDDATGAVLASGGEFTFEEATNFCLPFSEPCTIPDNLNAVQITSSSAMLTWAAVPAAQQYELQYLPEGAPMNQVVTLNLQSNSNLLVGLSANTTYLWRVRTLCNSDNSSYTSIQSFTTADDACPDADNDGVCDGDDQCPNFDDSLIGTSCDDGDDCTDNDVYTSDCDCAGTFQDADNDGICDAEDVCPGLDDALIGSTCDDGDDCTENDIYGSDCGCAGTLIDANNNDICDLNEGNGCTAPTNLQAGSLTGSSALLSWSFVPGANDYQLQYLEQGMPMNTITTLFVNDNSELITGLDPNTTYLWRVRAQCDSEDSPYSLIGNFMTTNGTCPDADNDGVCDGDDQCPNFDDSLIGTPCDDGDDCTDNDVYTSDCDCAGTLQDADNDGICDAEDVCPDLDDALIGSTCDDGDDCTENDIYGSDCGCAGTLIDANNNDICDLNEGCSDPTSLNAFALSGTSATFEWDQVPSANAYRLQYRPIGYNPTSIDISSTSYTDSNLPAGSTVQWRVRALCDNENSSFTNGNSFTLGSSLPMGTPAGTAWVVDSEFTLFPNPARGQVTLAVNHTAVVSTIVVRNMIGQTVGKYIMRDAGQLTLSTDDWGNNQVLLVTVYQEGRAPLSQRLVISR
jgi:hypothetical protein